MTKEEWKLHMDEGCDMTFEYNGKKYSLTWGTLDGKTVISFCEFYKETVDCDTFDEIIEKDYRGEKIINILLKAKNEDIYGY